MPEIRFVNQLGECPVTGRSGMIQVEYHSIPILGRRDTPYKKMSYRCINSGHCSIIEQGSECPIYKQLPTCTD